MCTDTSYEHLNKKIAPEGNADAPTLTLEYGPYKN
jgi:hypothetical protein